MPPPVEFTKISSDQWDALPKGKSVFFFPVGPLEDHGPHLPVGLDLNEASELCELAAAQLEREKPGWVGVILPGVPLGVDSNTTKFAITVRSHVLRDWLVDSCQSLIRGGFSHFVCFSGHLGPRQLTAIEDASRLIRHLGYWVKWRRWARREGGGRPSLISASSSGVTQKEVMKSPFWPDPEEHGGKRDTSVALATTPHQVDSNFKNLPKKDRIESRWYRNLKRRQSRLSGYWGDPREAEASLGTLQLKEAVERIFPKLRAVWEGTATEMAFKSWYSLLPPNKSFFRGWLLAFGILLVLGGWGILAAMTFQIH